MSDLEVIRSALRRGDFSARADLAEWLRDSAQDLAHDGLYLFAAVSRHEDLAVLRELVELTDDLSVVGRLTHCLGMTCSPQAISSLLDLADEFSTSHELRPDIAIGLRTIWPLEDLREGDNIDGVAAQYREVAERIAADGLYYFDGEPYFVGTFTKMVVTAAVVSRAHARPFSLFNKVKMLVAATGMECPVNYGDTVDDKQLQAVYDYVKQLASRPWTRGTKYYWGHPLL